MPELVNEVPAPAGVQLSRRRHRGAAGFRRGLGLLLIAGAVTGWTTPGLADEAAKPAEGAEGTGGGDGDCGGCGSDTVDKNDGDVCPEDKDCDDCEGGGADEGENDDLTGDGDPVPVAWDTGEKWESVVDLAVRVNGEDFELIRNYTSDPRLISNLYNSRYIPTQMDAGSFTNATGVIHRPNTTPSVGAGWSFAHLRSVSVGQLWGCERFQCTPSLNRDEAKFVRGEVWLNRPGRKPRKFLFQEELKATDTSISGLGGTGAGNQSVVLLEGATIVSEFTAPFDIIRCPLWTVPCPGVPATYVPKKIQAGTLQLHEPGKWRQEYAIENGVGFITHHEDAYGNRRVFEYDSNDKLTRIYLNGTTTGIGDQAEAWVDLFWQGTTAAPVLVRAEVYRPTGATTSVLTQYVDYYHLVNDSGLKVKRFVPGSGYVTVGAAPADLGTAGDLVQVVAYEAVDPLATTVEWRSKVTQYRYHRGVAGSGDDIRLETVGKNHQLKMVFKPQQVEFMAQRVREAEPFLTVNDATLAETATGLLWLDDADVVYSAGSQDVQLFEAAEKIVSYNTAQAYVANKTVESPVSHQFIQAADCGCGGGGAVTAKLRVYEQIDGWSAAPLGVSTPSYPGQSMHIKEYKLDDFTEMPTGTPYRTYAQDMLMLGADADKPYVWLKATIDEASGGPVWVSENLYNYDKRSLIGKYFPSTFTAYSRAAVGSPPTAPSVTRVADGQGYMVEYGYEVDGDTGEPANENVSTVRKGPKGSTVLVAGTTHRTDRSYRRHLPASRALYRVAGSSAADDVELTTFDYGFNVDEPFRIHWMKTTRERELTAENGIGGEVSSWEFYDGKGNVILTMDEGGTVTRYEHDPLTGELVRITENYYPSGGNWTAQVPGLVPPTSNPLPGSANGDGALVTEFGRDLLGRITKVTRPGGVEEWTVRGMSEDPERPGILYHTVTTLPHEVASGEHAGPARVRFVDAAGDATRVETMPVDGGSTYDPDGGVWSLLDGDDDILSRVVFTHDLSGAVAKRAEWWDYGSGTGQKDRKHETLYAYDAFGRLTEVTDPGGTVTQWSYDVLDRVLRVDQTTTGTGSYALPVALYFYDADPNAGGQAAGNGNITRIEARTIDANSGGIRETRLYYDFRNRLVGVAPDDGPIRITRYDNLDRPIESALYPNDGDPMPPLATVRTISAGALPNSAALGNGGASVARAQYARMSYSQRGLMYRAETAIDPASGSPQFLASNYWHDADGNQLAAWEPNSPGVVMTYDAHHRPKTMTLTDRAGDTAAVGASGRFGQATGVSGDRVIETASYQYDAASGVLTMVTGRQRRHGAAATGALSDSDAITSYVGFLYDSALRPTATVGFGTNQAGFQTGSTTAPSLSSYSAGLSALLADGDILFTHRTYNARGLVRDVTGTQDGAPLRTRYVYDHMGRTIAVIENASAVDESGVAWATDRYAVAGQSVDHPDRDRVTTFAYDGVGQVTARVAHVPVSNGSGGSQESVQETRYVYGVTSGSGIDTNPMQSAIFSNRLLRSVNYPHETTGLADPTGTNSAYDHLRVRYAYNAQGELKGVTDQNGTVRWIHRDRAGRVVHDIVDTPGASIDGTVRRLSYAYDQLGRLVSAASHTDADPGTSAVRDEAAFTYTPLWQIRTVAQQHDGAVTGSSPAVAYDYENAAPGTSDGNYSRLRKIIYPSDFTGAVDGGGAYTDDTVRFVYDSGLDDRIGRVTRLRVNGLTGVAGLQDLVAYDRVGLGMTARVELPHAGDVITGTGSTWKTVLDRTKKIDGTSAAGQYPAYDRFGRVTNHMWVRSDYGPQTPTPQAYANQPPIVAIAHTYDRMSNRLTAADARPGARLPFRDRVFTYDGLNQLVNEERTPAPTSGYTEQHLAQAWNLDMLGNWTTRLTDSEKDGDASDASGIGSHEIRAHNRANEIKDPNPSAQYDAIVQNASGSVVSRFVRYGYDDAGNMTEQRSASALPIPPTKMPGIVMTYDAWNRLIGTQHEPSVGSAVTISENRYNALGWRTVKRLDTSIGAYDGIDQERVMLYDAGWRMVEERVDTDLDEDADYVSQQFWGLRYIDDAVAKRINRDPGEGWVDNPGVSVWYQVTDSQFSVTAVLDHKGGLYERVEYDAYGVARHRPSGDANGDGLFNSFDLASYSGSGSIGGSGYHADWDLNFDGVVDTLDFGILTAQGTRTAALRSGWVSDPRASSTGPDNSVGYCGYVFNPEREDYTVRFRVYAPRLGRWRTRDPIGYAGGATLQLYAHNSPADYSDPTGLWPNPSAPGFNNHVEDTAWKYAQCPDTLRGYRPDCAKLKAEIDRKRKDWANALIIFSMLDGAVQEYYHDPNIIFSDAMFEYAFKVLAMATSYGGAKSMAGYWAKHGRLMFFWGKDSPGLLNMFIFEAAGVTWASMIDPFKWLTDLSKYLRDHFDIGDIIAERDKSKEVASRLRHELNKMTQHYEYYCGSLD